MAGRLGCGKDRRTIHAGSGKASPYDMVEERLADVRIVLPLVRSCSSLSAVIPEDSDGHALSTRVNYRRVYATACSEVQVLVASTVQSSSGPAGTIHALDWRKTAF